MLGCLKEPTKPPMAHPATGTSGLATAGSGFGKSPAGQALGSAEGSWGKGCPCSVVIPKGAEGLPGDREKHNFSSLSSGSTSDFSGVVSSPPGPTEGAKLGSRHAPTQAGLDEAGTASARVWVLPPL